MGLQLQVSAYAINKLEALKAEPEYTPVANTEAAMLATIAIWSKVSTDEPPLSFIRTAVNNYKKEPDLANELAVWEQFLNELETKFGSDVFNKESEVK